MLKTKVSRAATLLAVCATITGCMTIQPLEPVKNPPLKFRGDTTVPVEFVHPAKVGFRCAERGAKFLMMPGINSQACANTDLVTMPNPCLTVTGGWYADLLCHELAHANGWPHDHKGGNWLPDSIVHGAKYPEFAKRPNLMAAPKVAETAEETADPVVEAVIDENAENVADAQDVETTPVETVDAADAELEVAAADAESAV